MQDKKEEKTNKKWLELTQSLILQSIFFSFITNTDLMNVIKSDQIKILFFDPPYLVFSQNFLWINIKKESDLKNCLILCFFDFFFENWVWFCECKKYVLTFKIKIRISCYSEVLKQPCRCFDTSLNQIWFSFLFQIFWAK